MPQKKAATAKTRRKRSHPTQQDIAKALGLAQSTVATALNPEQRQKLQGATAERILEYAHKVGYRSSLFTPEQLPAVQDKPLIVLLGDIGPNTTVQTIFSELVNNINRYDVEPLPLIVQWFDNSAERLWQYLQGRSIAGIVLFNLVQSIQAEAIRKLIPDTIPIVSLQSSLDDVISLRTNIEEAYLRITSLHLAAGAKRIDLLLSPRDPGILIAPGWTMFARVQGFMNAIRNNGGQIVAEPEAAEMLKLQGIAASTADTVIEAASHRCTGTIHYPANKENTLSAQAHGYRTACTLIDEGQLPDVMICGNDNIAFGFYTACTDRGIRIPQDIKLIGCDDTDWSRYAPLPLSTIHSASDRLASEATRTIIDLVENRADKDIAYEKYFPVEIILRASSGDPEQLRQALQTLPASYAKSFIFESNSTLGRTQPR